MTFDPDSYLRGEPQPAAVVPPQPWSETVRQLDEALRDIERQLDGWDANPADPERGPTSFWGALSVRQNFHFACFVVVQLERRRRRLAWQVAPDEVRQELHALLIRARWAKKDLFVLL